MQSAINLIDKIVNPYKINIIKDDKKSFIKIKRRKRLIRRITNLFRHIVTNFKMNNFKGFSLEGTNVGYWKLIKTQKFRVR
tara:strand:- start:262 stop:504 length:243 start_codon:yes stop_codon:yes gene_type:complete